MVPREACFCRHEGIVPGRTPDLLWVFMWATGRGSSASLARLVFSELAARLPPLLMVLVPRMRPGSSSGSSCATAGVCSRGACRRLVLPSLGPLRVNLMPRGLTGHVTWPGGSSALSLAGAVPSGKGPSRCQGGLVRIMLLPPLPRKFLVRFSGMSLPSKLRKSVLSKPLPTRHGRSRSALALGALRDINT